MRSEWIKPWSKSRRSKKFGGQWAWGQRSEIRGYREQYKRKGLGGPDTGVKCVYSQKWFHSVALRYKCHQRSEHIVGSYPNCLLGLSWVNCPTQRPHAAIWEKWSWEVLLKKGVRDLRGQSWIRKERPVIKKSDLEKSRGSGDAIGIEQARVWGLSIQCKSWASPDLFQYIHSCPIQEKTKKLWYIKLSPWPLNTWVQCSTTEVVGATTSMSLLLQGNETWLLIYSGCQGQGEWGRLEALQGTRRNITEVWNQEAADGREPAPALTSDAGSSKSLFYLNRGRNCIRNHSRHLLHPTSYETRHSCQSFGFSIVAFEFHAFLRRVKRASCWSYYEHLKKAPLESGPACQEDVKLFHLGISPYLMTWLRRELPCLCRI